MFVCYECCVLSGRDLWDELITRPEESYRMWCVVVCDQETSRMRRPWPALGRSATENKLSQFLPVIRRRVTFGDIPHRRYESYGGGNRVYIGPVFRDNAKWMHPTKIYSDLQSRGKLNASKKWDKHMMRWYVSPGWNFIQDIRSYRRMRNASAQTINLIITSVGKKKSKTYT